MAEEEKELDTSTFWFIILPIMIICILFFGIYVLFRVSSVQTTHFDKLKQLMNERNKIDTMWTNKGAYTEGNSNVSLVTPPNSAYHK